MRYNDDNLYKLNKINNIHDMYNFPQKNLLNIYIFYFKLLENLK